MQNLASQPISSLGSRNFIFHCRPTLESLSVSHQPTNQQCHSPKTTLYSFLRAYLPLNKQSIDPSFWPVNAQKDGKCFFSANCSQLFLVVQKLFPNLFKNIYPSLYKRPTNNFTFHFIANKQASSPQISLVLFNNNFSPLSSSLCSCLLPTVHILTDNINVLIDFDDAGQ